MDRRRPDFRSVNHLSRFSCDGHTGDKEKDCVISLFSDKASLKHGVPKVIGLSILLQNGSIVGFNVNSNLICLKETYNYLEMTRGNQPLW